MRSATSTTASIGSSATICAISRPANENAAWPTSTAMSCTTPDHGRAHDAAVALGLGGGERRLRHLELRLEVDQLQLRQRAVHDELALGVELGALLRHHGLRLRDLRLARFVREDRDDVALLHPRAAAHAQLGEHAAGPRRDDDPLVGLGAAGEDELAAVRRHAQVLATATRNSFLASPLAGANAAARLSAHSCGRKWPDAIQSAAAATRPTAVMRLAFIGSSPRSRACAARAWRRAF